MVSGGTDNHLMLIYLSDSELTGKELLFFIRFCKAKSLTRLIVPPSAAVYPEPTTARLFIKWIFDDVCSKSGTECCPFPCR